MYVYNLILESGGRVHIGFFFAQNIKSFYHFGHHSNSDLSQFLVILLT